MPWSHLHYLPTSPLLFAFLLGLLGAAFVFVQLGVLTCAYRRLGLSSNTAFMLLLASLLGSYVNIPVAQLPSERIEAHEAVNYFGTRYSLPVEVDWPGTIVAINVGGALIPILLSLYLLVHNRIWAKGFIGVAIVTVAVHAVAQPVPGVGVTVPITGIVAVLLAGLRRSRPQTTAPPTRA